MQTKWAQHKVLAIGHLHNGEFASIENPYIKRSKYSNRAVSFSSNYCLTVIEHSLQPPL